MPRKPKYRKHSTRDVAIVEYQKKRHTLPGKYDSPESRAAYERFIRDVVNKEPPSYASVSPVGLTVRDMLSLYLDELEIEADRTDDNRNYLNHRTAYRQLCTQFGDVLAAQFGPLKLDEFQQSMAASEFMRSTIREYVAKVKSGFRWAASKELIDASVWQALGAVRNIQKNKTSAKEPPKKAVVAWEQIEGLLPYLSHVLGAMVQLQYYTGARSRSICLATPEQFEQGEDVMLWRPRHKTENKKGELILPLGPRAVEVVSPYFERGDDEYCFSPRESYPHPRSGLAYDSNSYGKAIQRALKKHGLPHWSPHQLRHAKAQAVREKFGIEAAQAVLGHSSIATTEIYSSRRLQLAIEVAKVEG